MPELKCNLDDTLPDWLIEYPDCIHVFEDLGLDTGCGGRSLGYECHRHGYSPQDVLERLRQAIATADDASDDS